MKKIAVITSTRAEYGLLFPVINEFRKRESKKFKAELIVTGTHLSYDYGHTIDEIIKDNVRIDYQIKIPIANNSSIDISNNMAIALTKFTKHFDSEKYDAVILLGDRYEILSVAIAAMNTKIPIFHLCGGDTTEGAIDESIRHSISKMSYLHFVSNEISRKRVIQLGESPERVFNVGSTSIDNILHTRLFSKDEVLRSIGLSDCKYALCTYHPVTLENENVYRQIYSFIETVKKYQNIEFIVTKSNSDQGGALINSILDIENDKISNLHVYSSLGIKKYLSLMKYCEFVLGNSSSGIIETPSFQVPTVNIGDRQKGRLQCDSIINCNDSQEGMVEAISLALTPAMKEQCLKVESPYGKGDAALKIVDISIKYLLSDINLKKSFYDFQ